MSRCSCPDLECACCFQESTTIELVAGDGEPGNCLQLGAKVDDDCTDATNILSSCPDGLSACIADSGNVEVTPIGAGACKTYELNYTGTVGGGTNVAAGCGVSVSTVGNTSTVGVLTGVGLCDGGLYCDNGTLKGPPPAINSNYEQPLGPTYTTPANVAVGPAGTPNVLVDYGTVALVTNQSFCKGSTVYLSGGGRQRLLHNTSVDTSNNAAFQYIGINGSPPEPHRYEAWARAGTLQSSAWSMGPRARTANVGAGGNVTIQEQNVFAWENNVVIAIAFWNPGGWAIHIDSTNNLA